MIDTITIWINGILNFVLISVLPAAVIFVVGALLIRVAMKLVTAILEKSKMESVAVNLITKVVKTVLYVLLVLIVASRMGIDVTGIVALASVLTLAVSLSVQDLLTNLVSGFTLLYTKPFGSGDYVEIAGKDGTVMEIGLTYTKLATPDNKLVFIPNGSVTSAQIVNYTDTGTRRVDFAITASYDAPIPTVLAALKEAAQVPGVLADHDVFVAVDNYGDHSIAYVLRVWSSTDDYWTVKFAINENIKKVFDAKGVEMTYPHLNIHMSK